MGMVTIPDSLAVDYLEARLKYDITEESLKILSKVESEKKKEVEQLLVGTIKSYKKELLDLSSKVCRCIPRSTNIACLDEVSGWYAVRYSDGGTPSVLVSLLIEKDLYMLERQTERTRDYSKAELQTAITAYVDTSALEVYKNLVYSRAAMSLGPEFCELGKVPTLEDRTSVIEVSRHAMIRWVERIMSMADTVPVEDYCRIHEKEISMSILGRYHKSRVLWTDTNNIQYSVDEDNIVYIVGNNNIITLYEEDFGFSKEINTRIINMQIDIIKECQKELQEVEQEYESSVEEIERDVLNITSEIDIHQAEIDHLLAKKSRLVATREERKSKLLKYRSKFTSEFNKLFRRFDGEVN